jgi:hypothetical protein
MNSIPSSVVVLALLGMAGGCASKRAPDSAVDRSAIRIGMTQREVEDLMRPVAHERAMDLEGNRTGVVYDTGDHFVFVDGHLQSHTRD